MNAIWYIYIVWLKCAYKNLFVSHIWCVIISLFLCSIAWGSIYLQPQVQCIFSGVYSILVLSSESWMINSLPFTIRKYSIKKVTGWNLIRCHFIQEPPLELILYGYAQNHKFYLYQYILFKIHSRFLYKWKQMDIIFVDINTEFCNEVVLIQLVCIFSYIILWSFLYPQFKAYCPLHHGYLY